MTSHGLIRRVALLSTATAALIALPSWAQSAETADSAAKVLDNNDSQVPVIIVTAQKRTQGLADVPISIATVDEKMLTETGADDASSFANLVPNFNVYEGYDRSELAVNVRGLTSGTSNPGIDPSVGFFIDGVYIARPAALTGKLTDISRIEVLRGPQGTLYGRNTSAGAVNIYTKDPTNTFETGFVLGYADYDTVDLRARVSGPMGEGLAGTISGFYGRQDSYLTNVATGKSLGSSEDYGARAKIVFDSGAGVKISLIGDYSKGTTNASRMVGVFQKNQADLFAIFQAAQQTGNPALLNFVRAVSNVPLPFSRKTGRSSQGEADNLEQYGFSGQLDWDMGPVSLTSITAYRHSEDFASLDADQSPQDLFLTSVLDKFRQFSQEVRLASTRSFDGFDFLVGLYYFDSSFTDNTQTQFGVPLFARFNATNPPNPITTPQKANSIASQDTSAWAIFGQLGYELMNNLKLTYGFRYNDEKKHGVTNQNPDRGINSSSGIPFPLQFPVFLDLRARVASTDFINMVSLNYKLNANSNIYATYSEGLKSGGINASILLNANGLTFGKETSTSYEVGYRNVFSNGLRLNLATFYTVFNNLQVQTFDPSNPANIIVVNAGKAKIYGLESDLYWPITKGLTLNLAAAYNHSEYVNTSFPGTMVGQNPALPGINLHLPTTVNVSGRRLSRAPEYTVSGGLQYQFALNSKLDASLRADYVYTSSQYLDAILSPETKIEGYSLVNLRAAVKSSDGQWELSVYGKNVFDKEYYTQIIASPAAAALGVDPQIATFMGVQGAPRVIGIELRKAF